MGGGYLCGGGGGGGGMGGGGFSGGMEGNMGGGLGGGLLVDLVCCMEDMFCGVGIFGLINSFEFVVVMDIDLSGLVMCLEVQGVVD